MACRDLVKIDVQDEESLSLFVINPLVFGVATLAIFGWFSSFWIASVVWVVCLLLMVLFC